MIIAGLQPETAYSITVAAYTMKGDGARSKPKVVTTKGAGESLFLSLNPFPKAKELLQTHHLSSHSLLKGQTCSKSQAAPKAKSDLVRQKPLHSSHAALTKCHSFLPSASESPGTPRNTTEDEFVPCNLLGCKFQCTKRKVTLPGLTGDAAALQVAHAGTLGTGEVCCQGGDLQRPEEQQADSGGLFCPLFSSGTRSGCTSPVFSTAGGRNSDSIDLSWLPFLGSACTKPKSFPSLTLFFPCSSAHVSPQ